MTAKRVASARAKKTTAELLKEARLRVIELQEQYETQVYFETMPEYGPTYEYSYGRSNFAIPYEQQSVDAWLRAIIKHMGKRNTGHGGAYTAAVVVSIPSFKTDEGIQRWLDYVTATLRKRALKSKQKSLET